MVDDSYGWSRWPFDASALDLSLLTERLALKDYEESTRQKSGMTNPVMALTRQCCEIHVFELVVAVKWMSLSDEER